MATIAEIRANYPQYKDMSDADLGAALHKKYYADMPFDEFAAKVGLNQNTSFIDKLSANKQAREKQMQVIADQYVAGDIGEAEALGRMGVKYSQQLPDASFSAMQQGFEALPESWQSNIKEGAKDVVSSVASVPVPFSESTVGDLASSAIQKYQAFEKQHPVAAGRISSVADVGNLVAPFVKVGGKSAINVAEEAAKQSLKTLVKVAGVGKVIEKGTDVAARQAALKTGEIVKSNLSKPMQKVYDRLRADFPNDADFQKALYSYASKQGESLIERGGQRIANLAESAAQYPSGGAAAVEFFGKKVEDAPQKIKQSLIKAVGRDTNYLDAVDEVVSAGRMKAAPIYKAAYAKNQSISSPRIDRILQTPEGKSALAEAVKNMQNEMALVSKPDKELTAALKELVDLGLAEEVTGVGVGRGLKLQTLDYVKRAMDSTYNKAVREGGGEAGRILNLKKGLVAELDRLDKSKLYAKARSISGDYLSTRDSMESGLKFFKEDPEIVDRVYNGLKGSDKTAFKVGVMKAARDIIDTTTDGRNVATLFGKQATRNKLQTILSPKDYAKLLEEANATDKIYKLRNNIIGNSRTAQRLLSASEFEEAGKEIISDVVTRGWRNVATDKVVGWVGRQFDGLSDKAAREVSEILYETNPKKKYQIVKALVNQAKESSSELRKTEAAKKLKAFYSIAEAINGEKKTIKYVIPVSRFIKDQSSSMGNVPIAPAIAGGAAAANALEQPLRITINPAAQGTEGIPDVQLPAGFKDIEPSDVQLPATIPDTQPQASLLNRIMMAESSGRPMAMNDKSTAAGLFQFTDGTWNSMVKKYGDAYGITKADKMNPQAQQTMANLLLQENGNLLTRSLGRQLDDGDYYVAHVLDAPDAARVLKAHDKGKSIAAASLVGKGVPSANRGIFYDGNRPRSVREVVAILKNKVKTA